MPSSTRTRWTLVAALAAVVVAVAVPAGAAAPRPSGQVRPGGIEVGLEGTGRRATPGAARSGSARHRCTSFADDGGRATTRPIRAVDVPPGGAYWRRCTELATGVVGPLRRIVVPAGPGADGFEERLPVPLPAPAISSSPSVDVGTVIGVESWLWLDRWEAVAAPLTREGATVIAIGVPRQVTWTITDPAGRATSVVCDGPGRPYGALPSAFEVASPCVHRFAAAGPHAITATLRWEVGWIATTGASEELGFTTTSSTVELTVHELDTVITG